MKSFSLKPYLLFLPSVLFMLLPLYGLLTAVLNSFGRHRGWTLDYYRQIFESKRFVMSLAFSLQTALIATLLSILIGLVLTRSFYPILEKITPRVSVWIPMLFPHFVWGYLVILLLSETGVAAQLLTAAGWISDPQHFPVLTRDPHGIGIILTYVWKEVPLVILMLLPVYASIRPEYYALVDTLGGSVWNRITAVELPHLLPVLMETSLIIFSFTLSAYEVPALLGTTFPEMVSVLSYDWFYGSSWQKRPLAFAAMVSISFVLLVLSFIGYGYLNKARWRAVKGNRS
ncbi:ABC transporter permease [Halobacillus litoralis]|uniref:ABC transporter permease n=1 Tax=Halobacillus litoralis TaxID=45668 RepID=UPI00136CDA02|nr:ABC transporter permease subunit [Halobacillus litoralis]MYL39880.1 ABC transporter permease subunit [Halobacillus litoralis]